MAGITNATYPSTGTDYYTRVIFPKKMLRQLYASSIYELISNTEYKGDIEGGGDTVNIAVDPLITTFSYDAAVGIPTYVEPTVAGVTLNIDQAEGWAYKLKSTSEAASALMLKDSFARSATASLKVAIDRNVLAYWPTMAHADNLGATAGAISGNIDLGVLGAGTSRVVTAADIMHFIHECNQVLDEQEVDEMGRWITLPAWMVTLLKDSDIKDAGITGDSKGVIRTGVLGTIDGFLLCRTNNLPWEATNAQSTICFGVNEATTFAAQLIETTSGQLENDYGMYFRGLTVFGRSVVQPKMIGTAIVSAA